MPAEQTAAAAQPAWKAGIDTLLNVASTAAQTWMNYKLGKKAPAATKAGETPAVPGGPAGARGGGMSTQTMLLIGGGVVAAGIVGWMMLKRRR